MKRRIEWNGRNNILVLDNRPHGTIEMTLDEFVELATDLKTGLHLRYDGEDDLLSTSFEEELASPPDAPAFGWGFRRCALERPGD